MGSSRAERALERPRPARHGDHQRGTSRHGYQPLPEVIGRDRFPVGSTRGRSGGGSGAQRSALFSVDGVSKNGVLSRKDP